MAYSVGEPGTPEWWLNRLVQRLVDRQSRYDVLEAYVEGNHPLPDGDERYVVALKSMQRKARTNYIGMVTRTPVERMTIKAIRVAGEIDDDAAQVWSSNNMDYQSPIVHLTAASLGDNYILVSPADPNNLFSPNVPLITAEDPRVCITEADPANPQITRAGLRMWQDDTLGQIIAVLYLPDAIYKYVGPSVYDCNNLDTPGLTQRLLSGAAGGGLQLVGDPEPNPIGVVPIINAGWIPSYKGISKSEAEDVIDIQDRINSTILDRMVISRSQAYKQRWAKGIKLPKSKTGQQKPPFDPGADMLWVTDSDTAEFGEFKEADIRQVLEAVRDDVSDMAAITKTPPHYLMGKVSNVSGSTLTQAEAGLISKTRQRMIAMGWAWERVVRLAFLYTGNAKATDPDIEIVWADPELHTRIELSDAFIKEVQGGLPLVIAAARLGLDPDQLAAVAEHQKKLEEQEAADKAEQLSMQKEQLKAQAAAPKAAPPGAPK